MKRILIGLLCALLLCGCAQSTTSDAQTVTFYYRSIPGQYASEAGVVCGENYKKTPESTLQSILQAYFSGPTQENLRAPFSSQTRLLDLSVQEDSATITLSSHFTYTAGIDRSIACACIAKTVMDITGCKSVTILAGTADNANRVQITLKAEDILLSDITPAQEG